MTLKDGYEVQPPEAKAPDLRPASMPSRRIPPNMTNPANGMIQ